VLSLLSPPSATTFSSGRPLSLIQEAPTLLQRLPTAIDQPTLVTLSTFLTSS
jgi:hypothetical protein